MAETNLNFAKIVSTPTPTGWSQAYSAGTLFAAFSLQTDAIPQEGQEHLNLAGKDLISTLESEFFTLENKDLESIKGAILASTARIREGISASLIVCFLTENVLYLFAANGAKAILKRGDKIGTVLEGDESSSNIKTASGYVQEGDTIVLQTKPFLKIVSSSELASSLDNNTPDEIAESLAPHVHEKAEGGAAAVILKYKKGEFPEIVVPIVTPVSDDSQEQVAPVEERQNLGSQPVSETKNLDEPIDISSQNLETPLPTIPVIGEDEVGNLPTETQSPFLSDQMPKRRMPSFTFLSKLPRQRRIIATIAAMLVVLILVTLVFAVVNKNGSKNQKLFDNIYTQAQTKYQEGANLKDLNAPLAQESFKEAQKTLRDNQSKFTDSKQKQQIDALLAKISKEISFSGGVEASAKEVDAKNSKLLSSEIDNSKATYFTQDSNYVYFLDGAGISQIDKGNDKKTSIVKKSWKTDGGIGLFGSNVYVLDKAAGILKFVPDSSGSYSKIDYFSGSSPDLSSSIDMAIDGSVYILNKDGSITRYTKGKEDPISITGLDKPISGSAKIFTNADLTNIYILDKGNSRIVVLDKTGKFKSAYSAAVIKNSKDFDTDEKNKKIYILSSSKVYQIDIK